MKNISNETIRAWEQQEDETEKAFEAFEIYREMGAERSLVKAAQRLGKSTTLLEKWSRKHAWQSRVRAHTRWIARAVNEEILLGTAEMRRRHTNSAIALQNQVLTRLLSMTPAEIEKLSVSEMLAMLKIGAAAETKSRDIKPEEMGTDEALTVPTFFIEFIPSMPPGMVSVRLADGQCGYIPTSEVDRFFGDYPDAIMLT